jgi:hypothetical protein
MLVDGFRVTWDILCTHSHKSDEKHTYLTRTALHDLTVIITEYVYVLIAHGNRLRTSFVSNRLSVGSVSSGFE